MKFSADQILQQGIKAHKAGQVQQAERLYKSILQEQPNHPDANHNLGVLTLSLGKPELSLSYFEAALEANPRQEQYWLSTIDALIKDGQFDNASKLIQQGQDRGLKGEKLDQLAKQLELDKTHLFWRSHSASRTPQRDQIDALVALYNQGQLEELNQQANALLKQFPEAIVLLNILGAANTSLKRFDAAIAHYNHVLKLKPDLAQVHSNLGDVYKQAGNLKASIKSCKRAITLKPDLAEAHYNLGNAQLETGELDTAIESYGRAIQLKPDYAESHNNLGFAQRKTDNFAAAIESFQHALQLKPDYAEAHNNLGTELQRKGDLGGAIEAYENAIQLKPDYVGALNNLGNVYTEIEDVDAAIETYQRAIQLKPDYAEIYSNLGKAFLENKELDGATKSCQQAIELKPDLAEAYNILGNVHKQKDNLEAAVENYRRAVQLNPDFADAHYNLGNAFLTLGQFDKALSNYEKAGTPNSFAQCLICLYALGLYEEFDLRVSENEDIYKTDITVAAICAFYSNQTNRKNLHKFCTMPLEFLSFGQINQHIDNSNDFINRLDEELKLVPSSWEPYGKATHLGLQTKGNLFQTKTRCISKLEEIVKEEITSYYSNFKSDSCLFIDLWPKETSLRSWSVRLQRHGYQSPHIHPGAWLSGVVYLKLVKSENPDEGAIEFRLHGDTFPVLSKEYPKFLYRPKRGDIVLFPSSLFHRTIPIKNDGERLIVSFDLVP